MVSCSPDSIFSPLITYRLLLCLFCVCKQTRKDGGHEAVSGVGKSTWLKVLRRASSELEMICVTFVTQRDDLRGIKCKVVEALSYWIEMRNDNICDF